MIYIIIGGTNSGKSSLTKNMFIKNKDIIVRKDIVTISETNDCILIGDYNRKNRRVGTDTIARADIKKMGDQVEALINTNKDIVLEGMRCVSRPLFNKLLSLNVDITLVWMECSPEASFKRANEYNGKENDGVKYTFCKREYTACKNIFNEYVDKMHTILINTEDTKDFTKLSL